METIKANILKAISEEHKSVYGVTSSLIKGINDLDSSEAMMAVSLGNALDRWADTRESMHRELNSMIRTAEKHKADIKSNFCVGSGWLTSTKFEEYIKTAEKYENECSSLLVVVGILSVDRVELFKVIGSLIKY